MQIPAGTVSKFRLEAAASMVVCILGDDEMNDPSASDEPNQAMLDDLHAEFMAGVSIGERDKFDFALEFSDAVNMSAQELLMAFMTVAERGSADIALWAIMARQSFLNVMQKEVAPQWVETEYARRNQENMHLRNEWEDEDLARNIGV